MQGRGTFVQQCGCILRLVSEHSFARSQYCFRSTSPLYVAMRNQARPLLPLSPLNEAFHRYSLCVVKALAWFRQIRLAGLRISGTLPQRPTFLLSYKEVSLKGEHPVRFRFARTLGDSA